MVHSWLASRTVQTERPILRKDSIRRPPKGNHPDADFVDTSLVVLTVLGVSGSCLGVCGFLHAPELLAGRGFLNPRAVAFNVLFGEKPILIGRSFGAAAFLPKEV